MEFEYEQFIKTIQHGAEVSWEEAERAAATTLSTLAERISAGEARDIAEQLPGDLGRWLSAANGAEAFHADEFLRRIAEREEVDLGTAERHAKAVFAALGPAEEFVERVADRTGLVGDSAQRATEAVLEVLGERIAAGEVEDLAAQLPAPLRSPLKRGDARTNGKAKRMSLDEFAERVAELEDVSLDEAREHASAMFRTLREAVSEKEFRDLLAELPVEYRELLRR